MRPSEKAHAMGDTGSKLLAKRLTSLVQPDETPTAPPNAKRRSSKAKPDQGRIECPGLKLSSSSKNNKNNNQNTHHHHHYYLRWSAGLLVAQARVGRVGLYVKCWRPLVRLAAIRWSLPALLVRSSAGRCSAGPPKLVRQPAGPPVRWSAGPPVRPSPPVRWSAGPLVRWSAGPPVRRFAGRWSAGPPVRRSAGPLVRRSAGPPVRRSAGPLVRWSAGRWSAGSPVRWSAGPPVRWSAGPPVRWSAWTVRGS